MSDKIDQRLITVVNAIKQAIETGVSPGLSVNRHPNMFFLHVNGEIDLKRIAELALQRLDTYDAHAKVDYDLKAINAAGALAERFPHDPHQMPPI
jgi:hypothetical protein